MLYFKPSEFNISGEPIPEYVADKLQEFHIVPLSRVREKFGEPIIVSKRSGYRSLKWELAHGRPGTSRHVFKGKGAVDLTADDLDKLLDYLIKYSPYTRICKYNSFIHCDYGSIKRQLYKYDPEESSWIFLKEIPDPQI